MFLVSLAYIVGACIYGDDERITRSVMFFISLLAGLAGSIMGEKRRNKQPIPAKVLKRMIFLFGCSIVAILIGHFTDYLIIGCAVAFILGCIALFDALRAVKSSERT